ncbi:unnamed protein product [Adineta steineri]|uniref:protein-tyrosine-phosphatase n=1 Tax=Adineta steineri TaxID=433720 RepID=A0A818RSG9_9BILA|nr:unnamed protein product [Adineta steineri]CAF3610312.1 unnamed protein product [Adineta steineri]CAF3658535.1 unnamed protein product [Adineta steineri]
MSTDVLDEHHFKSQCSLYESTHTKLAKDTIRLSTTTSTILGTSSMSTPTRYRRVKYPTQINASSSSSSSNSIHNRHSGSTDILSLIRSFAMKPFKASSMTNAVAGGQTRNVISGSNTHSKHAVNLLRYRPLSDVVTDHDSYTQPTHTVEDFLKRMGWPINSGTDEARVKWNTAMKFLIPSKFDVNRAVDLYTTHENLRKTENLDHIWINNPNLIREIQSSKFFSLPQIINQPLTVIFTASNSNHSISNSSLSLQERELITLQALICQLDVATESAEVQQNGLNFIYDMQNCSATQFDMNLSKKILKLLQGGYPAMLKNIFIVSAPKWFRVTLFSIDQMREYLRKQCGYPLDNIPISLGGTFDPIDSGNTRYQLCSSKVTNKQSICSSYYSSDYQPLITKSTKNILVVNTDYHNQDKSINSPTTIVTSSPSPLLTLVSLRYNNDTSAKIRIRKRESSSSSDNDKRPRSNDDLIEEESPMIKSSSSLRKENFDDQSKHNENTYRIYTGQQEKNDYKTNNNMNGNDYREFVKRDTKRSTITNVYKSLNETEFLSKTHQEIKHEFRKMSNPPAKDTHAAKDEKNLDKSRYRDVIPGELTRVKLQPDSEDKHDFINANYVSGYNNQEKAYIFTQGPLQSTVKDFWRMIWQENISIIVMTTNIRESGTMKCYPYWPLETKDHLNAGLYQIQNETSDKYDSFVVTTLLLKKKNNSETRTIYHAHYLKWPDHGIPTGTKDALLFLEKVEYYKQLTKTTAPILLHCSAGIGRTGTFCAIDMGIKRYLNEKLIDIPSTVVKMRHERSGSVQTEDQYLFAHLALMDFIKQHRAIQERMTSLELTISSNPLESDPTIRSPLINTSKIINLQEPFPHRTKKSHGISLTDDQYLTSITRQQASFEHVSSLPSTNTNGTHRKFRK